MDLARNLIHRINVGDTLTRSAATRPASSRSSTATAASPTRSSTPTSTDWRTA